MGSLSKTINVIACISLALNITLPTPILASSSPILKPLSPIIDHELDPAYNLPPPSPIPQASPVLPFAGGSKSDRVTTLLQEAITEHNLGKTALSEKTFRQVLQIDPNNADAHFSLGAIAEGRGDLQGAEQHYKAALATNPNDQDTQNALYTVENKLHDIQAAKDNANTQKAQATLLNKDRTKLQQLSNEAASAYRNGNYDQAISCLEQVRQVAPRDPDVLYALSQAYRGKGNFIQAQFYIGQAVALDPNNQMYRSVQASIAQEANNQQMAMNPNNQAPAGQITPITPEAGQGSNNRQYGYASGDSYSSGSATSSRLSRMAIRGLTGAAAGAAFGGMMGGRSGMGRGALFGGLAGLIFGGF